MRKFEGFERGVNLGGWLSQISEVSYEHFDTFITEEDIKKIASWGLDHVRVPVDYFVIETEDGQPIERGYEYIDKCVSWCRKHGLHMIIDIHKTFGYTFDPLDKTDKLIFFHSEELQNRFYKFWRTISRRYSKDCDIVAYELLNEIVSPEVVAEWNMIATKAVAAIREDSPNTWVIYGGVCYNAVSSVEKLPNPNDDKVVHTFHCYEPMIFTHQGAFWVTGMPLDFRTSYPVTESTYREMLTKLPPELANAIDPEAIKLDGEAFFEAIFESAIAAAEKNNVPLYCGEYGVIDRASCEDTLRWVEKIGSVFRKHGIGRSYWNFKSMDYEICGERFAKDIDKLVKLL